MPGTGPPGRAEGPPATRPRRVLLADDNADVVEMYAIMLGARGLDVRVAHDGQAAVEEACAFRPDVVLTDIGLPSLDRFALAERLRSRPETSEVLLIALSGSARDEDRRRALAVGFDDYLTKPVRLVRVEELLAAPRRPRDDRDGRPASVRREPR